MPEKCKIAQLVIAYEPVWAIGSGHLPEPEEISDAHKLIRKTLGEMGGAVQVIYGGSVTPQTAGPILDQAEVDGVLPGAASLTADGFWAIAEKCR